MVCKNSAHHTPGQAQYPIQVTIRWHNVCRYIVSIYVVQASPLCPDPGSYTCHTSTANQASYLYYETPHPVHQTLACAVSLTSPCESQCGNVNGVFDQ